MNRILELKEKRNRLIKEGRDLLDKAKVENRAQSAEEEARYDAIFDESDKIAKQIQREERQLELDRQIASTETELENRSKPADRDEKRDAFRKLILNGPAGLTHNEVRALQADNDALGGYLMVPSVLANQLIKNVDDLVFIRQLASKFTVAASQSLGFPELKADPSDADWTSELDTGSEDTAMSFGRRELKPKALAKRIKISNQLLRSQGMSAENLVMSRLAYKFGITEEKAFLTGDGAGKPLGIFTASSDGISTSRDISTGNTATAITMDGLIEAKYALKAQYVPKAVWLFNRTAIKNIAKLKGTTNDQYYWQPSKIIGEPDMLMGIPVLMSEYVPNTFTTGQYVGAIGDFTHYHIVDSLDMQIQRLQELYAVSNQVGIICRRETDGAPVLEEAFARITLA
jgi:HK97 family phage major capsid protein